MLKTRIDFIEEFIAERRNYPESCAKVIAALPEKLTAKEIAKSALTQRRDLRALKTFTIDGAAAKDLDDAISLTVDAEGFIHLYVHIADVAHYVKANGKIDKEARKRGNTYYLVDTVLPMLPLALSNNLCSLNPNEPKLCLTSELVYTATGDFVKGELYESLIESDVRATYEDIYNYFANPTEILSDNKDPLLVAETKKYRKQKTDCVSLSLVEQALKEQEFSVTMPAKYQLIAEEIMLAKQLAAHLRNKRVANGSIMFDLPELTFSLDADGKPIGAAYSQITWANQLIEEFMIAANEFVAAYAKQHKLPIVYRVHGEPDRERIEDFLRLAKELKLSLPSIFYQRRKAIKPKHISNLLAANKEHQAAQTIEALLLRTMAKAIYSPEPLGHFGLALADYCHFTSPIRRYSDLLTHRVLKNYFHHLHQERIAKQLTEICNYISEQERQAITMERDVKTQMAARYLYDYVGMNYTAKISGFVERGLFLVLENGIEGFLPYNCLQDHFVFIPELMVAKGMRYGKNLHLGETLEVQLAKVNLDNFLVDFVALDPTLGQAAKRIKGQPAKRKFKTVKAAPKLHVKHDLTGTKSDTELSEIFVKRKGKQKRQTRKLQRHKGRKRQR